MLGTFYFIAGIALLVVMAQSKYILFHVGLVGALNIIASYGMIKAGGRWFYVVVSTSIISLVFGSVTTAAIIKLLNLNLTNTLILLGTVIYTLLSFTSLIYTIYATRKTSKKS